MLGHVRAEGEGEDTRAGLSMQDRHTRLKPGILSTATSLAGKGNMWLCRCGVPPCRLDHRGEADHRSRLQVWSTAGADCNFYTGCWGEPPSSASHFEKPVAGMGCMLCFLAQHAVSAFLTSLQQVPLKVRYQGSLQSLCHFA